MFGDQRGTPCIMARSRFSTFWAPRSVASISEVFCYLTAVRDTHPFSNRSVRREYLAGQRTYAYNSVEALDSIGEKAFVFLLR